LNRRSLYGAPLFNAVLPATFFQRPAAKVARDLLGKKLVRQQGTALTSFMIVETEAYEGAHDLASHSSRGRTPRTEVMFGPAVTALPFGNQHDRLRVALKGWAVDDTYDGRRRRLRARSVVEVLSREKELGWPIARFEAMVFGRFHQ
jgi:hypothetical protein